MNGKLKWVAASVVVIASVIAYQPALNIGFWTADSRSRSHSGDSRMSRVITSQVLIFVSGFVVVVLALITYFPSFQVGFFGDEWNYLRLVAQLPLFEYLNGYFNPRALSWYVFRPVQGIQYLIEYNLFHANPVGYHGVEISFHAMNCLLLFGLVSRISGTWRLGLVAGLIFASFSVFGWSVIWSADAGPLETVFYLSSMIFWLRYLQRESAGDYYLALLMALSALFSRESSVTLIATLFLMDRMLFNKPLGWTGVLRRYFPFAVLWIAFLAIAFVTRQTVSGGIYANYRIGTHIVTNLFRYLAMMVYPWSYDSWLNEFLFVVAILFLTFSIMRKQNANLLFLVTLSVVVLTPFLPYVLFGERYFYMPALISATWLALCFESLRQKISRNWHFQSFAEGAIALFLVVNSWGVRGKIDETADLARFSQSQFRPILQRHRNFPETTYLYFINPPASSVDIGGMFYLNYGSRVQVRGTDLVGTAGLRQRLPSLVLRRDTNGEWYEQSVEIESVTAATPVLPTIFEDGILLKGYELVRTKNKREDAIIIFLYWQATTKIEKNYTVFVHLIDQNRRMYGGTDNWPVEGGAPTSTWQAGTLITDWAIVPISPEALPGADYRLEVGLYHFPTMQRLSVLDDQGNPISDYITIAPIEIIE